MRRLMIPCDNCEKVEEVCENCEKCKAKAILDNINIWHLQIL